MCRTELGTVILPLSAQACSVPSLQCASPQSILHSGRDWHLPACTPTLKLLDEVISMPRCAGRCVRHLSKRLCTHIRTCLYRRQKCRRCTSLHGVFYALCTGHVAQWKSGPFLLPSGCRGKSQVRTLPWSIMFLPIPSGNGMQGQVHHRCILSHYAVLCFRASLCVTTQAALYCVRCACRRAEHLHACTDCPRACGTHDELIIARRLDSTPCNAHSIIMRYETLTS